jgi:hypothetical protein
MFPSPDRTTLYRRARGAVICAVAALSLAPVGFSQLGHTPKKNKGPRAVGLVELSSDGKARLIPVAIMIDGKFYDAAAYKAMPVPMAIWGDTIYEAERTGVSQGLFTVNEAVKAGNSWWANGKWVPAGAKPLKKHVETKPNFDEDSGPPKLRRPEGDKSAPSAAPSDSKPPAETKTPSDTKTPPDAKAPSDTKPPSDSKSPADAKSQPTPAPSSPPTQSSPDDEGAATKPAAPGNTSSNDEDPNRPVLARGKVESLGSTQHSASAPSGPKPSSITSKDKAASGKSATTKSTDRAASLQLLPAVSDAGGPDPRPYSYDLKSDEEQKIRKKMLAMAGDLIVARAKPADAKPAPTKTTTRAGTARHTAKPPQPSFDDVQFHAYDLWNTNEPVFILSAKAQMPKSASGGAGDSSDLTYYITLVVKQDIYGDLRKLNATVTDTRHLDETPRMELIDAVDADGDGRGELLFREISDVGSVYGIYRAGADQLFPLFEGAR